MKKKATTTIIFFTFRLLPLPARKALFRALAILFYYLDARHRIITLHNLTRSFPDKSMQEAVRIAKGAYRHIGTIAAEFFEIPYLTRENLSDYLEIEGTGIHGGGFLPQQGRALHRRPFRQLGADGRFHADCIQTLAGHYRPLDNPILDDLVHWVRTVHGNVMLPREGSVHQNLPAAGPEQYHGDSR